MRRWLALAVAALVALPLAVLAGTGTGSSKLELQTYAFRDAPATTASMNWKDIPDLNGVVCAAGGVSATASLVISSGAGDFRVQIDGKGASAHPGLAHFDSSSGTTSFSFTWVNNVGTQGGTDAHRFSVQWRSPSGQPVTLAAASLAVRFERSPPGPECGEDPPDVPNIVLILTDDQRWDTLWAMPNVQSLLVDHGVAFDNAFAVNPTCCPSRAAILKGQYSHSTGIYKNTPPFGGFDSFDDDSTVATWLHDAGYRTAHIGKYLNGYEDAPYIPPGWDRWVAFTSDNGNGNYLNYDLSVDGVATHYGSSGDDYSTDVFSAEAVSFIESTPVTEPLFLYFTPKGPHEPSTPAPRHSGAFSDLPPWRPPSYNEDDVSDKPGYIRNRPQLTLEQQATLDALRIDQYRTLLAVDDAVGAIMEALQESSRLQNTLIVFASDNGYLWGEHRWTQKDVPYEESIRIPMVVRYDPVVPAPRSEDNLVANIDLAPTFAEAAGLPGQDVEGVSLLPLITSPFIPWRTDLGVEHLRSGVPTYCAVRSEQYLYVDFFTGTTELYDLAVDPFQLDNVVRLPAYADVVADLAARLAVLCDPPPPL